MNAINAPINRIAIVMNCPGSTGIQTQQEANKIVQVSTTVYHFSFMKLPIHGTSKSLY